ncbi:lipid-A-disaccharide synthase [Fusobacterium sp. PH5-44]|uniref:lipid-A-disaccharide synthase n=1 Tax=unclassified Fusobacterium TaxID=2648384 RepID=UPI003D201D1A
MKIFVSTGEVSGDLHISYIINAIQKQDNNIKFIGVCGDHCRKLGVEVIQDINDLAIMGFTEVIKKYSFLKKKAYEYLRIIKEEDIEKVILVDYGGFNLKFLELLKKEVPHVKTYYYIPPKLWIWGKNRLKKLILSDEIMVIFPWEVDFYKKNNVDVIYYGNPFIEKYKFLNRTEEYILLLPGSREQEVKRLFPVMEKVIKEKKNENFLLKLSSKEHAKWLGEKYGKYTNLRVVVEESLEKLVEQSKIAICASGTVTLELAIMGIPAIVVYITGKINAFIGRHVLKLGFVSLPNLTLNREVYPELLQEDCNSELILKKMESILNNREEKKTMKINLEEVRGKLKINNEDIIGSYGNFILK